jgi:catechol 2,3-dioxygenase-like lactoylglutathione lyase family enzyme
MEHIIDHIGVSVKDFPRAKAFYAKAFAPLGITMVMEFATFIGFGRGKPEFWISAEKILDQRGEDGVSDG